MALPAAPAHKEVHIGLVQICSGALDANSHASLAGTRYLEWSAQYKESQPSSRKSLGRTSFLPAHAGTTRRMSAVAGAFLNCFICTTPCTCLNVTIMNNEWGFWVANGCVCAALDAWRPSLFFHPFYMQSCYDVSERLIVCNADCKIGVTCHPNYLCVRPEKPSLITSFIPDAISSIVHCSAVSCTVKLPSPAWARGPILCTAALTATQVVGGQVGEVASATAWATAEMSWAIAVKLWLPSVTRVVVIRVAAPAPSPNCLPSTLPPLATLLPWAAP